MAKALTPDYDLSVYASLLKVDDGDDGTAYVYGKATDTGEDLDKQGIDPAWLNKAMPDWYENWGNIRAMHKPEAVGIAKDLQIEEDGFYIGAKVVDPTAVMKVREGLYKGFSIGIKSPIVVRDPRYKGGLIKGGKIVEVSLVDHPANERSKFTLVKADDLEKTLPPIVDEDEADKEADADLTKGTPDDKQDDNHTAHDKESGDKTKEDADGDADEDDSKDKPLFGRKTVLAALGFDAEAVEAIDKAVEASDSAGTLSAMHSAIVKMAPDLKGDDVDEAKVAEIVKTAVDGLKADIAPAIAKAIGIPEDGDLTTVITETIKTVLTEQPEIVKAAVSSEDGEEADALSERVKAVEAELAELGGQAGGKAYLGSALQQKQADKTDPEIEAKRNLYKSLTTHQDRAVREEAKIKLAALDEE